jgi:dTDP-D-glucose 4,6-dehydratase
LLECKTCHPSILVNIGVVRRHFLQDHSQDGSRVLYVDRLASAGGLQAAEKYTGLKSQGFPKHSLADVESLGDWVREALIFAVNNPARELHVAADLSSALAFFFFYRLLYFLG